MTITKVKIKNYRCFKDFEFEPNPGLNLLVGNNEAGKSTILEAIHLALTGLLNGRYLRNELSQYLFNKDVEQDYLKSLSTGSVLPLPEILIEVYLDGAPKLNGDDNTDKDSAASGVWLRIEFDSDYQAEYDELIKNHTADPVMSLPIEYYRITWQSFARNAVTSRSIPLKSLIIDSSASRFSNGSDIYVSRIVRNHLDDKEKVEVAQAYRKMKDQFASDPSIVAINKKVSSSAAISGKDVAIDVDLATISSWEGGLATMLDEIPFHYIGKGEQCIVKTNLALGTKQSQNASLILIEEPENHLSHGKLNELIKDIQTKAGPKQIIISTHSSFVANKLGLDALILLHESKIAKLEHLPTNTQDYFRKLPGYQTLRLLLCNKAILVEGPSDELIVQRAYMDETGGKLPIEDGIDVISVGTSFLQFLHIANIIKKPVAVVTDNDGNYTDKVTKKYRPFASEACIKIFADSRDQLNTLEPQLVDANNADLEEFCKIAEIDFLKYSTESDIAEYMQKKGKKTECALSIFSSSDKITYPQYIKDAIDWSLA